MNAQETMEKLRSAVGAACEYIDRHAQDVEELSHLDNVLDEVQIQLVGLENENHDLRNQLNTARRSY